MILTVIVAVQRSTDNEGMVESSVLNLAEKVIINLSAYRKSLSKAVRQLLGIYDDFQLLDKSQTGTVRLEHQLTFSATTLIEKGIELVLRFDGEHQNLTIYSHGKKVYTYNDTNIVTLTGVYIMQWTVPLAEAMRISFSANRIPEHLRAEM